MAPAAALIPALAPLKQGEYGLEVFPDRCIYDDFVRDHLNLAH